MSSLKEQLLKAGLVTKQDTQKKPKHKAPAKPKKQPQKKRKKLNDITLRTQRAMLNKAKKDKKLNEQRKAEEQTKQLATQVKKIVDGNKLDRSEAKVAYHFTFKKKVKSVLVTEQQQTQLSNNTIAIISLQNELFEIVPKAIAEKIAEQAPNCVIQNNTNPEPDLSENDLYSDYQVPEDLKW